MIGVRSEAVCFFVVNVEDERHTRGAQFDDRAGCACGECKGVGDIELHERGGFLLTTEADIDPCAAVVAAHFDVGVFVVMEEAPSEVGLLSAWEGVGFVVFADGAPKHFKERELFGDVFLNGDVEHQAEGDCDEEGEDVQEGFHAFLQESDVGELRFVFCLWSGGLRQVLRIGWGVEGR